jgi:alginate O-acetyltransferase complex protein AlgI
VRFNSLTFAVFLALVFPCSWAIARVTAKARWQNTFLIVASCVFYGWVNPRVILLLLAVVSIAYVTGLAMTRPSLGPQVKKLMCAGGIVVSLAILGYFKYAGFFSKSFARLLGGLGLHADKFTLDVALPVGISFYVFMAVAYIVDVYRGRVPAERDPITFFAFGTFFPQLLAGPIGRAPDLLPQYAGLRSFNDDDARDALRQIMWGLLKKMVIADNIAAIVDKSWANLPSGGGLTLLAVAVLYSIQIYCDFSGYSDIAIGVARLFGIRLMLNFHYPYFATNVSDFWRRWHISLSSWFRDYVYIPLGGSRLSGRRRYGNIIATFTLTGLWHGAGWTFVLWGLLHGLYYLPLQLWQHFHPGGFRAVLPGANAGVLQEGEELRRVKRVSAKKRVVTLGAALLTFAQVTFAWILFRAPSVSSAGDYIGRLFGPTRDSAQLQACLPWLGASVLLLGWEWTQRHHSHPLELARLPVTARWAVYSAIVLLVLFVGSFGSRQFIYVRF